MSGWYRCGAWTLTIAPYGGSGDLMPMRGIKQLGTRQLRAVRWVIIHLASTRNIGLADKLSRLAGNGRNGRDG